MADQPTTGTAVQPTGHEVPGAQQTHHGRPVSWVAVAIIMAAFLTGGLGLILGPIWWLFWGSLGVAAAGGLLALSTHIFDDWY